MLGGRLDLYVQRTYNEPGWRDKQGLLSPKKANHRKYQIYSPLYSQFSRLRKKIATYKAERKGRGGGALRIEWISAITSNATAAMIQDFATKRYALPWIISHMLLTLPLGFRIRSEIPGRKA
jgi:hypothetical protein